MGKDELIWKAVIPSLRGKTCKGMILYVYKCAVVVMAESQRSRNPFKSHASNQS